VSKVNPKENRAYLFLLEVSKALVTEEGLCRALDAVEGERDMGHTSW